MCNSGLCLFEADLLANYMLLQGFTMIDDRLNRNIQQLGLLKGNGRGTMKKFENLIVWSWNMHHLGMLNFFYCVDCGI